MESNKKNENGQPLYKRWLAVMLAVSMLLTSTSFQTFAEEAGSEPQAVETADTNQVSATEDKNENEIQPEEGKDPGQDETRPAEDEETRRQSEAQDESESLAGESEEAGVQSETQPASEQVTSQQEETGSQQQVQDPSKDSAVNTANTSNEEEKESEMASESEETKPEAVLESSVKQEVFRDTDGSLAVKYTVKVRNKTSDADADKVAVKAVLGEKLSWYEKEGQTAGLICISDIKQIPEGVNLRELKDIPAEELDAYASAIVWQEQTINGGQEKEYTFFAHVGEEIDSISDLPAIYIVDGNRIAPEKQQWLNQEILTKATTDESTGTAGRARSPRRNASQAPTALQQFADGLFGPEGTAEVATLTIGQIPEDTVQSGDTVTWYLTFMVKGSASYKYEEFTSTQKTLYDAYENTAITITAPEGITIQSAETGGYDYHKSDDGTSLVISLGNLLADSDQSISFTVVAAVDKADDNDSAIPTGKRYEFPQKNAKFSTTIKALDRDNGNEVVGTYSIEKNTSTDTKDMTLTSTTSDEWSATKENAIFSKEVRDGETYLKLEYNASLRMNEATDWATYAGNGRVNFKELRLTDVPVIGYKDGTDTTEKPVRIEITPENYNGETVVVGDWRDPVDEAVITTYATKANLKDSPSALESTPATVPVYSTYKVTVWYQNVFSSEFFDIKDFELKNDLTLAYTLDYAEDTTPVTGENTSSVVQNYRDVSEPASISLQKKIDSIFGGGNYVTETAKLEERFTGDAAFTILDSSGNDAQVYILTTPATQDQDAVYSRISNVITFSRGAMKVDVVSADGTFVTESGKEYTGKLYLMDGTYTVQETKNQIAYTNIGKMTATGFTLSGQGEGVYKFTVAEKTDGTITATNTDTLGGISFAKQSVDFKTSTNASALEGVTFGLFETEEAAENAAGTEDAPLKEVSGADGKVSFDKLVPGIWYIKELDVPDGYLIDRNVYRVEVTANQRTTQLKDSEEKSTGTLKNRRNRESVFFQKYLLSLLTDENGEVTTTRVAVSQEDLSIFTSSFQLQRRENDSDEWRAVGEPFGLKRVQSGESVEGSESEEGTTVVSDMSYALLENLPVYKDDDVTKPYSYRIVETLPRDFSGYGTDYIDLGDGKIATPSFTLTDGEAISSLTNMTTGAVTMEKWYYLASGNDVVARAAGEAANYPNVTGYICKLVDGKYVAVKSGTTELRDVAGENDTTSKRSRLTLDELDLLDSVGNPLPYYWAEPVSTGDVSYVLDGTNGQTAMVEAEGEQVECYVSTKAAYAAVYDSENMPTTLNNVLPYRRVSIQKYAVYGDKATSEYLAGAKFTVKQVSNGTESVYGGYNNSGIGSLGATLILRTGYVYHLYETEKPANTSGLKNNKGNAIDYITIDLTNTKANSIDQIKQGAGSYPLYDEPYRQVKLEKNLVNEYGGSAPDNNAEFTIYVSDTADGVYEVYKTGYKGNSTVALEPSKYYSFVELPRDGIVPPELYGTGSAYAEGTDREAGYFTAKSEDGTEVHLFGFRTGLLKAENSLYELGELNNYKNLGSLILRKYINGTSTPLADAKIRLYRKEADGSLSELKTLTTDSTGTLDETAFGYLPVYDENEERITYCVKEIEAPEGYFLNEEGLEVQLVPCQKVSKTYAADPEDAEDLIIYNEPQVTVNVQVTWENCEEKDGEIEGGGEEQKSYLKSLTGATVAAYRKVTGEDGTVTWQYVAKAVSNETGMATFTGLSRREEYAFVLAESGATEANLYTEDKNYPLYASEDGTLVYMGTEKEVLTDEELKGYSHDIYKNNGEISYTFNSENEGNLNNHLLYTQIHVTKYCILYQEHDKSAYYVLESGEEAALVNGSTFTLYRQRLTEEQIEALAAGQTVTIPYDTTKLVRVDTYESGSSGLGMVDFNAVTYGEMFAYWLVEDSPAAAHGYPDGMSYFRALLYASDLLPGTLTSEDASQVAAYTKNEEQRFEVPNTHRPGSPHEYFRTYLCMNKWQGSYDEYGEVTEEVSPLGGAEFTYWVANSDDSVRLNLFGGQSTTSMSSNKSLGYLSPGAVYYTTVFNDYLVSIVNRAGYTAASVKDITPEMLDGVSSEIWASYSGMLYAYKGINAETLDQLVDLASNDGAVAKEFLADYKATYPSSWSVAEMENVLASTGRIGAKGYEAFYAHILFHESKQPANFLLNETTYTVYLQFTATGPNGSANTKYFWLDGNYYKEDTNGSLPHDDSLDNSEKVRIDNLPDPEYSVTITKYGYELNGENIGKTDDELDQYFNEVAGGSQRIALSDTVFRLQRYNKQQETWKYYTYDSENKIGSYVDSMDQALELRTNSNGYVTQLLPIGWYRLIETSTKDGYEILYDGSTVDGNIAARYFFVRNLEAGNAVSVYDPLRMTLNVWKGTLSDWNGARDGIRITLTDKKDVSRKYEAVISGGKAEFVTLPVGTYTVSESVEAGHKLTGTYFKPFDITLKYEVKSNDAGEIYIDSIVREMDDDANGAICEAGKADTIAAGTGYTDTELTIHNPRKGELTITKVDAVNTNSVLSGSMYKATFELYYKPFDAFLTDDTYVADVSEENKPVFNSTTRSEWSKLSGSYETIGGKIRVPDLEPGWYAVVETKAPSYYELADPVVTYVRGDMTDGHAYTTDSVKVADWRKTTLTVQKRFDLSDFFSELADSARSYKVTFGLYVKDVKTGKYIPAAEAGVASSSSVAFTTPYVSGNELYNSSWWYNQLVQMGEKLNPDGTYTSKKGTNTYTLDGKYYIRENKVEAKSGSAYVDISKDWWLSSVTFSYAGTTTNQSANEDGYIPLTGFERNRTASIRFVNSYAYAKVVIQKTGNNGTTLTGANFIVRDKEDNVVEGATCEDMGDGSYTIIVPMKTLTKSTYSIWEDTAPEHYMLNPDPIVVELKSGDSLNFGSDSTLIMEDQNGVNVILTKYDNVYSRKKTANKLDGVTFTLFRSEYDKETEKWGAWEKLEESTTGSGANSTGVLVFDTVVIDPSSYRYLLAETDYDTTRYVGMETLWHGNIQLDDTEEIQYEGKTLTGYKLPIATTDIGADYTMAAYNEPFLNVTLYKTSADNASAVPGTVLAAYPIADTYAAGAKLTEEQVAELSSGEPIRTGTTSGSTKVNGKTCSTAVLPLPVGTYLIKETQAGTGYVLDKEDAREIWYQIIKVEVPVTGKAVTVDTPFVNVKQSYSVKVTKAGTSKLESSLLENPAQLKYDLNVAVTASGPVNELILTDKGLTVTKTYDHITGDVKSKVDTSIVEQYLQDKYNVTSLSIPTDAVYEYQNLVFTNGDKESFVPQIRAKVTFTYSDGTTDDGQSTLLSLVSGDYWTVTPQLTGKKAIGFTIQWYDEALKTAAGYDLGAAFRVSASKKTIGLDLTIQQQAVGSTDYHAVAEIKNEAEVSYHYTDWKAVGTSSDATKTASATALCEVPNAKAPILKINKSVENVSDPGRNLSKQVISGDVLKYTLKLENISNVLGMADPVLIDLLPRGVDVETATASEFAAKVALMETYDGLAIDRVQLLGNSEGYNVLVIYLKGTLKPTQSVELTLEGTVGNSIIDYISSTTELKNTAYVTSTQQGVIYNANPVGSVFEGETGATSNVVAWAGDLSENYTEDSVLKDILSQNGFEGYGYLRADAEVNYVSSSAVTLLKKATGDQDGDEWKYGADAARATANRTDDAGDDGTADFQLTLDNADTTKDLLNPVLLDIIPKKGDNPDLHGVRNSKWSLDFDGITGVSIIGRDEEGRETVQTVDSSSYTVWYYTGEVDSVTVEDWRTGLKTACYQGDGWTSTVPEDKSAITAFVLEFTGSFKVPSGNRLIVTYHTTVPKMSEDEVIVAAHDAARNSYSVYYKSVLPGSEAYDKATPLKDVMTSNEVAVLLETPPVKVGGMFWIDADGDGLQDEEDVTDASPTDAGTFNARTSKFSGYEAVQALLATGSMSLTTYKGAQEGNTTKQTSNRYLFEGLTSASLANASYSENYDEDGVVWNRLTGNNQAVTYRMNAAVGGNVGIKYRLTEPRYNNGSTVNSVASYSPLELYGANMNTYLENILRDSNFTGDTGITAGSLAAASEKFFLYSTDNQYDLSKDIGLVLYRDLEISKKDALNHPVKGAQFKVYGPYAAGAAKDVTAAKLAGVEPIATGTTDEDGLLTVENLLYFQEYIIVESAAVSGYDTQNAAGSGTNVSASSINMAWILSIPTAKEEYKDKNGVQDPTAFNTEDTDHMLVTNYLQNGKLEFSKIEKGTVRVVSGAEFKLSCNSTTVSSVWENWLVTMSGKTAAELAAMGIANVTIAAEAGKPVLKFKTAFSDEVKKVQLENLPYGDYALEETAPPQGYALGDTTLWEITIDQDTVSVGGTGIENPYVPKGSLTLKAQKTEKNYESDPAKQYTFEVYAADETWTVASDAKPLSTAQISGEGTADFAEIKYDTAGTYYYIVKEQIPADTNHITYDTAQYRVKVTVADSEEHNGTLLATVTEVTKATGETTESLVTAGTRDTYTFGFVNEYKATGELPLSVTKKVVDSEGNPYKEDLRKDLIFTFVLYQGLDAIQQITVSGEELFAVGSADNTGSATVPFEALQYDITSVGNTYTYTVREIVTGTNLPAGYSVNQESYTIKVEPSDNGNGTLDVTPVITKAGSGVVDEIAFTNVYKPEGATSLTLSKMLDGKKNGIPEDTFSVSIRQLKLDDSGKPYKDDIDDYASDDAGAVADINAQGSASFIPSRDYDSQIVGGTVYNKFNFRAPGTYWYLVTENIPADAENANDGTYSYDTTKYFVKITMSDDYQGHLTRSVLEVHKGSPDDPVASAESASGITFVNLSTTGYEVYKEWEDNGTGTTLDSVTVQLQRKTGSGEWQNVGDPVVLNDDNEWHNAWTALEKYDASQNKYEYRAVETASNKVIEAGGTIAGKYGSSYVAGYTDTAADEMNNTGSTTITNTIQNGNITVKKTVTGRGGDMDRAFNFTVKFWLEEDNTLTGSYLWEKKGSDGSTTSGTAVLSSGEYAFTLKHGEEITFKDLPVGVKYKVTEEDASADGYAATVSDAGSGTIKGSGSTVTYKNYYAKGSLTLKGAKTISNMPADSSRTFNFQVKEGTKVKTTGSATVNSDGTTNFSFAPIEYTLSDLPSDGKFTYTIEEVRPADATQNTDGTYTYQGYTYDSSVYTVEVTVTDDGEGNLGPVITEVKKDGEKLELVDGDYTFGFGNSYLAVGSTQIKAQKLLDDQGDKVTADTFEFTLTEGSVDRNVFTEKEGGQNQQAKAAAGGAVAFNKIDYTTEGTYWYRIVENDVDGYICDKTEYFVKVEVTDDKAGELTAVQTLYCGGTDEEHRYSGSEIQFTNYTTTSFMAEKKWNDDTEALRPDSVYIMLMRSTDLNNWNLVNVNNSVNGDGSPNYLDDIAQLTAGNGWKKTWTNLEKNVFGDATAIYYYKAVEVAVTKTGDEITDFQILSSGSTISTKNGNSNYVVSYDDVDYDAEIPVSVIQNSLGGNVRVQKVVNNEVDPDQEFSFRLVFRSAPKPYAETYGYRIYTVNGTEESTVKIGSITYAANYDFKLKNGQILEIQNLPIGTRYELYEDNISGYTVEYTNKAGELTEDTPTVTVTATNTYFASGSLTLQAGKRLNDERTIVPQDTFTFELVEAAAGEDGAILTVKEEDAVPDAKIVVPDTENGGITGTVTFSTITKSDDSGIYNTENGTDYWYILTEKSLTGDAGKAYESDPTIYCIRVNVKDIDHNGSLTLTKKVYTGTQNEDGTITVGSEIDGIPVFDNYSTISITARKVWSGDDAVKELTRPASVLVALQKKIITDGTEGTWENVEIQALSEDNDWAYTWDGLRNTEKTDSHILEYTYRAVEVALKADKAEEDPSTLTAADYEQITEFDGRGGSLYEVSGPVVAADGSTNTITNTLQTADLKLEKAVIGSGEDQDTEFTFVIELTDKDGNALTGTYDYNIYTKGADGDTLTESGSLNSYIKLKHSQYVAVKNLPIGTKYTVTETENKEYSTAWSVAGGNAGTGTTMTGTIMRSSEETQAGSYVTYTNTRLHGLNISKQQSGGSSNDTFQVQVEVQYAGETELALYSGDYILYTADAPDGISGSTEDGKITFRDGETIHIDLPYNTEYKVTEILTSDDEDPSTWYEAPLYSVSTTDSEEASEPSEEPAEGNSSVGSAVYIQNQHKTGSLQISKSAEGGYPDAEFAFQVGLNILDTDKTQQYTVTYTKTDEDGKTVTAKPDTYIDSENDDHPGNVVLQAGWTAVIESIDTGKTVTVTETSVTALIDDVVTEIPLSEYDTFINGSDTVSRDRIYRTSIAEDKQYTASYRNVYKTGSISIKKKNASENGHKDEVITSSEAVFVLLRRIGSKWYYMTSYDGQKSYDAVTWSEEGYTLEELEETDFDSELTDAYRITTTLGECILDHMEIGAYGLIEIEAPEGFDKTEEAILFELTEEAPDEDGEIPAICESVSVGNREKYGSVKFTKIDSVTELPLDGATFILTRTDLAEPVQIVKFTSGSEAEAEIYAEDDEDNPTIYHEVTVERDENGVTAITNLPWGVYTLKEICSPEYVQPDTEDPDYEAFTEEFLIGLNQENNFLQDIDKGILRNIRVRGDLTIRKIVSSRYEADFDKEFEYTVTIHDFYQSVAAGEKYLLKITDIDGQETVKDLVLDEDGNVTEILKLKADETAVISGIPAGSIYSVEEKEDIDFTGEIRAVGAEVDPEDPLKAEGTITGETTAHSAFYTNTRNTAEVSFTKLDKLSGAVVTGTSFEIREQTAAGQTDKVIAFTIRTKGDGYGLTDITYGSVYEPKDDGEVIHAAVDETGKITVSGLRYGTYELIETEVAGGYEWPDDEVAGICTLGAENKKGRFGTDGIVENTPTQVEIRKTDLVDLEIVGAALEIRYAKDFTAPDGTMYKADTLAKDQSGTVLQWTSDGTGKKIIGLYTQALYTLVETAPPTGYAYAEAITFSMDKFGIVSVFDKDGNAVTAEDGIVKMEDTPLHFIVNKVKSGSTEEIEGAYLTVYNSRNEIVDSWISKVGETHDFGRVLTAGETYILRETKVPDGYQYIGDMKFQVAKDGTITTEITSQTNNDGTVVYLVENTATSTRFEKVDENNNLLAGAVLQILDKSGTVVHEWTTTSDAYEVTGLTADTEYILHEKKAPSGYTYAEDITFTVSVKETVTVTMVDKRSKEPKTGDDTPITMHLLLLTAAVMAMLVLAIFRRRRRAELLK